MPEGLSDLKPIYLIYGEEDLLLERALTRLRKRVEEAGGSDFDVDVLDAESAEPDAVVASANMLPLMSARRLVILRGLDKYPADRLEPLIDYAGDPNPTTTLVLVAAKIAKNMRIYKAVDALGGVGHYAAPKRGEYPRIVIELFADRGKTIGRDAAEVLARAVGFDTQAKDNLRRLEIEVEKVLAYTGERETLSRQDVEEVVSETAPTSIFELTDAIAARDCRGALTLLARLVDAQESVLGIHALSLRLVRQLLSARAVMDRPHSSRSGDGLASVLGVQPWLATKISRQAERYSTVELIEALRMAAESEAQMKTSRDPRLVYERWLVAVCTGDYAGKRP